MRLSQLTSAIAMALSLTSLGLPQRAQRAAARRAASSARKAGRVARKANGQRESLRAFRRAQGGPGIELTAGVWHPRNPAGLQGDGQ